MRGTGGDLGSDPESRDEHVLCGRHVRAGLSINPTAFGLGRRLNADGSYLTGASFFLQTTFDQYGSGFTEGSRFNDCVITSGFCAGFLDLSLGEDQIEGPVSGDPGSARPDLIIDVSRWDCDPEDEACERGD